MVTTRPPKTIVKPTALGPGANTDTKLLIYGLFQKGRVLAQDGSSLSESRVSAFPRFPGSKGLPGTPSPAGSRRQPKCVVDSITEGSLGFAAKELQADEIRTFTGNKKTPSWVFVTIEVWSRLWPSTVTGRRSYLAGSRSHPAAGG